MNFDDREIDDEKLMSEIDKLDTDYVVNSREEAPKTKKKFLINENILFVFLLIIVLFAYVLYDNFAKRNVSKEESKQNYELQENTAEKNTFNIESLKENIENEDEFNKAKQKIEIVSKDIGIDNNLIICLKNNNSNSLFEFDVFAIYYDGDNIPIKIRQERVNCIDPNEEIYVSFDEVEGYERFDILITKDYFFNDNESLKRNVKYETYKQGEKIKIKGKNISNSKLSNIDFQIVYLDQNGKALGLTKEYKYDVGKNKTFEIDCFEFYDKNYDEVEYSDYKVIIENVY